MSITRAPTYAPAPPSGILAGMCLAAHDRRAVRRSPFKPHARGRLSAVDGQGAANAAYLYNAMGERAQKDARGKTEFIYDLSGNLIAEANNGGHVEKQYVWLGGLPVAMIAEGNTVYYIHADHLGQPQKMTDVRQKTVWSRAADPFGNTVKIDGNPNLMNLRFPGQYFDAESGLADNGFRSYNAAVGRYTQSDPIGLAGGLNRYGYVGQNPVNAVDPLGLDWVYSQSTGTIAHYPISIWVPPDQPISLPNGPNPDYVGPAYSGKGPGLYNPSKQNVPNVGPIPRGKWAIGPGHYSPNTGPNTMTLTPWSGTNTYGRTLFRIHGDNKFGNKSASEGCIVTGSTVRSEIGNSDDPTLWVIP